MLSGTKVSCVGAGLPPNTNINKTVIVCDILIETKQLHIYRISERPQKIMRNSTRQTHPYTKN